MKIKAWCVWDKQDRTVTHTTRTTQEAELFISVFPTPDRYEVKPCTVEVDE